MATTLRLNVADTETVIDMLRDYRDAVACNGEANEAAQRLTEWVDERATRSKLIEPAG